VGIDLPIVGRFFVSTRPVHGETQVRQFIGGRKGRSVDHRADRLAIGSGIDADVIGRIRPWRWRWRPGYKHDVINVICGDGVAGIVLKPKAVEVRLIGHAQRRKGNGELLPRVGSQRSHDYRLPLAARIQGANNGQILSPGRPAIGPKSEVCEQARINFGHRTDIEINRAISLRADTDGIRVPRPHRAGVGEIDGRTPTPIRPPILQGVGINDHIGLRPGAGKRRQRRHQSGCGAKLNGICFHFIFPPSFSTFQ